MGGSKRLLDALCEEALAFAGVPQPERLLRRRFAEKLAAPELVARQVDRQPGRQTVPGMALNPPPVAQDIRDQDIPAQVAANQQRGDVALAARRVLARPFARIGGRV